MRIPLTAQRLAVVAIALLTAASDAPAQRVAPSDASDRIVLSDNLIVPQARVFTSRGRTSPVRIAGVSANVSILQQIATTTFEIAVENPAASQQEAELLVPVPDGAVIRSFTFDGAGRESTARLLPKAEAVATYQAIVNKLRDPALLEFAAYNVVRSSVFPVPPNGKQHVRFTYDHVLTGDGDRVDYVLPRSESFDSSATPCTISVSIKSPRPVAAVFSPSHVVSTERRNANHVAVTATGSPGVAPGPFRLSYLVEGNGPAASLLAYPDPTIGGGYFVLFAGLPTPVSVNAAPIKREVTLVIDRSGSMAGGKLDQAKAAALQVLEALDEGEAFNVIDYSDTVASFAERPVVKDASTIGAARAYVRALRSDGGTNIRDALVEALRPEPAAGMLPLVLFLTDGLASVGETREFAIRDSIAKANEHHRRVFSFGVGYDVNAPLLTGIATATRATSTFVLPNENVEAKVSQTFRRLAGPQLASPRIEVLDATGNVTTQAVRELLPTEIGDVFEGDQIVLFGQYRGEGPLTFRLEGDAPDGHRSLAFAFDLDKASTRNAFVPRLWANRKIARLIDAIAQGGADGPSKLGEEQMKELTSEIVRLSLEFGILTEYTAFLATEGSDLSSREVITVQAGDNLRNRAQNERSGIGAVNQQMNNNDLGTQVAMNRSNVYLDQNMNRVETTNVQQIQDRTFYRRGDRWVDARVVEREKTVKPDRIVTFGTKAFDQLVEQLVAEGRQGILALDGEMMLVIDGKVVLVKK